MFRFLLKRIAILNPLSKSTIPTFHHHFFIKFSSVSQEKKKGDSSLTISYLVNSCGLSPQYALSVSHRVTIKNTENPNSVIKVLKSYEFTDTQIAKLVTNAPFILSAKPEKTVQPKLDFILSLGFSRSQLANFIPSCWKLLWISLENRLKTNVRLLEGVYENKEKLALAIRRNYRLLITNVEKYYLPNVEMLKLYGVPCSNIAKLATNNPHAMLKPTGMFEEAVQVVKSMGFNPCSGLFVDGIQVVLGLKQSSWERKVSMYKSVGWSKEDVNFAFVRQPNCMLTSEKKIKQSMEFFVKKMNWNPSFLAKHPVLLKLNLPKRVMPRCLVISLLVKKDLVRKISPTTYLKLSNENFFNKYVAKYQDEVPEVLPAYNEGLVFASRQVLNHIRRLHFVASVRFKFDGNNGTIRWLHFVTSGFFQTQMHVSSDVA